MPLQRSPRDSGFPRERREPEVPFVPDRGDISDTRIPLRAPDYRPTPPDESSGGEENVVRRGVVDDLREEFIVGVGNVIEM